MTSKTLAAALICLAALSAPAFALDIGIGASASGGLSLDVDAGVSVGGSLDLSTSDSTAAGIAANASGGASLTGSVELDRVIALIDASVWTRTSLSGVAELQATAYDVSAWVNTGNAATLDAALSGKAGEIADLRAAVAANATLEAWLKANNATAADVIAIGVAADGSLAVFID